MKSLIVEDSRLARVELKELLRPHTHIQLCGEAANSREALPILLEERPELLFLDINMPGKNGFELLQQIDYEPKVIFITAYAEFALQSFEFTTVDYLLKPISEDRLKTALNKLAISIDCKANTNVLAPASQVLLRSGEECHWVRVQDIQYMESVGNYTQVYWGQKSALIHRPLVRIEDRLPVESFFRVNRQQVVNLNKIVKIDPWFNKGFKLQLILGVEIEVSRRHATRFKDLFCL